MRKIVNITLLALIILITGCGTDNSQNNAVPKMQSVPEQSIVQQNSHQEKVKSFRALNTETDNYYRNALGKSGAELKQTLHEIISKQTVLNYRGTEMWNAISDTDQDPNNSNNVMLFYAGRSDPKSNHGGNQGQWNKEHVWAQNHGKFGRDRGIGSDLHNLKPEDVRVNGDRGNLNFDITEIQTNGENKYPLAPDTYKDEDSWEPRDEIKGDVARIILYMDTRYEDHDNNEMDLKAVDGIPQNADPVHGKLSTLLKWHEEDPVDAFEKRRNNVIYERYQHNRNPFIDHPEWVSQIWK